MIGQFVDKYASDPITVYPNQANRFRYSWAALSPNYTMLLANKHLCLFAWEAYIWQWLDFAVFDEKSAVWAGDVGEALTEVVLLAKSKLSNYIDRSLG